MPYRKSMANTGKTWLDIPFLCTRVFGYIYITGEWNLQRPALFSSMSEHNLHAYISWFMSH